MTTAAALKVVVSLDANGVKAGTSEAKAELASIGEVAQTVTPKLVQTEAALSSVAAASGRSHLSLIEGGKAAASSTALASHQVTNLSYQLNDIAVGLTSGQSPFTIMMQQGSQVSQILGNRGLGSIFPALANGLMSMINPTTLVLVGLTAIGYAGAAAFRTVFPEVKSLNDLFKDQADTLSKLKGSYSDATDEAKRYSRESNAVLTYRAQHNADLTEQALQAQFKNLPIMTPSQFREIERRSTGVDPTAQSVFEGTGGPVGAAMELFNTSAKGTKEIRALEGELLRVAGDKAFETTIRSMADSLLSFVDELAKASNQLDAFGNRSGTIESHLADERNNSALGLYQSQQAVAAKRAREAQSAAILGINARSPLELAEAARATAAAQYKDEDGPARALRIEQAGTLALIKSTHDLSEAQKSRTRSLNETIATAELDLSLIGKSAAEVNRLKTEHQLLSAVRKDAAAKGIEVDQQEVALIRQKAAEYARLTAITSARDLIRSKGEDLAKMQLELTLIGAGNEARALALAQYQAEVDIRNRGLDLYGSEAEAIRNQVKEMAKLNSELAKNEDAWNSLKSSGESAVDGFVQKLGSGDITGALQSLGDDLMKFSLQMMVANPLKNWMFGGEHGTMNDVVNGGMLGKLFGKGGKGASDAAGAAISAMNNVAAMEVTASIVNVNGAGVAGSLGGTNGLATALSGGNAQAANDNSNTGQIWNFFQKKGLKDFQISAIMGNLTAESGLNPNAINPSSGAAGLAQHLGSRLTGLLSAGGGKLPGMGGQLDYIWKELQGPEKGVLKNLLSSTNLRQATGAFAGFERAEGYTKANPEGIALFDRRLSSASLLLEKFGGTTVDATSATAGLGKGMSSAISALGSLGGMGGGKSFMGPMKPASGGAPSLFSALFSGFDQALGGLFGFDSGGWTGDNHPSKVSGVTHGQEFVVKAGPAAANRPLLEAINANRMPGYAKGGWVGSAPQGTSGEASRGGGVNIQIIDNAGVSKRQETERDGNGTDVIRLVLDRVGSEIGAGNYDSQLGGRFGAKPIRVAR